MVGGLVSGGFLEGYIWDGGESTNGWTEVFLEVDYDERGLERLFCHFMAKGLGCEGLEGVVMIGGRFADLEVDVSYRRWGREVEGLAR